MLKIGQVAAPAGVNASDIRFYEDERALPEPEPGGGRRGDGEERLRRLGIIDAAQRAGLSLDEIRALTGAPHAGDEIRVLAERKLPDIEALITRAEAVKRWLELARACDCETVEVCPLFSDRALAPPRR